MRREEIIAKWAELGAREKDAWIATAVMGWRRVSRPGGGGGYIGWQDAEGRVVAIEADYSMTVDSRDYFRPSRDISAAWMVFERFPYIEVARIPGAKTTYGVRINGLDGSVRAMTQESTFPDAVCIAALIAELTEVITNGTAPDGTKYRVKIEDIVALAQRFISEYYAGLAYGAERAHLRAAKELRKQAAVERFNAWDGRMAE